MVSEELVLRTLTVQLEDICRAMISENVVQFSCKKKSGVNRVL
jgi:hypothetical protein